MEYAKFFNFMDLFLLLMVILCLLSYFIEKGLIHYYRKIKKIHHRDKIYEYIRNIFIGYNVVLVNVFYIAVVVYILMLVISLINYFI